MSKTMLHFKLRPVDFEKLNDEARGNKSFLVRKMVSDYLANPHPFEPIDDRLMQTSASIPDEMLEQLRECAKDQNTSLMQLARQIIEHGLRGRG